MENSPTGRWKAAVLALLACNLCAAFLSVASLNAIADSARAVGYAWMLKGESQRLIKKEIMKYPDEGLADRLDSVVESLIPGGGDFSPVQIEDDVFSGNMLEVRSRWREIKSEIARMRETGDPSRLYMMSETFFYLADRTAMSGMAHLEGLLDRAAGMAMVREIAFASLALCGFLMWARSRSAAPGFGPSSDKEHYDAEMLMNNRAGCEREINLIAENPPPGDTTVFLFAFAAPEDSDEIDCPPESGNIADLGRILREEGEAWGFVGRFSDREFLAIFRDCGEVEASGFMASINERVISHYLMHFGESMKTSFMAGRCTGNASDIGIRRMVWEAGRNMRAKKLKKAGDMA
ncbi:MAG: hypothetical protein LBQ36_01205 [Synergistaceae bacterium]|jgi:hypothetical protein|nr:hypothetical protein [Synergistaceae bacterium]